MKKYIFFVFVAVLLLVGCTNNRKNEEQVETLVLASFATDSELNRQVELFNQSQTEYKIEIRQYQRSERVEEDGITKLQKEIISGNGPDIINFGNGYSVTDIMGEYTENLYPYIAKMTKESKNEYFINVFDAFSYQEGLYAVPVNFSLQTCAGRWSVIGDKESWTIEELMDCYSREKEKTDDSLMLYPGETKKDVFGSIILGSIGNYVDWEKGTSSFTSDEFKKVMEFSNQFPDRLVIAEEFSPMQSFADGKALLYPVYIADVYDICNAEMVLDEKVTYIGYPTQECGGTIVQPGKWVLAISAGSEHKDVAWEFISRFFALEYQQELADGLPINKQALENQLIEAQTIEYEEDAGGNQVPVVKSRIGFEGEEPIEIYQITDEQGDILLGIIEKAALGTAYDRTLHTILLEEVESYFSGDKSVEEVAEVMQSRALSYMGE